MNPYEKIKELTLRKKISVRELEKRLGYSNGYFSKWKSVSPNSDGLSKVADYFGVSTDYLLGRTDNPDGYYYSDETMSTVNMIIDSQNEDFMELIGNLSYLDDSEMKVVNDMVKSIVSLKQKKS